MKMLVTGCLGFIGSHFVKYTLDKYPDVVIRGFNRASSPKHINRLGAYANDRQFELIYGDLANPQDVSGLLEGVDCVVNFAAKTFVDHSICRS